MKQVTHFLLGLRVKQNVIGNFKPQIKLTLLLWQPYPGSRQPMFFKMYFSLTKLLTYTTCGRFFPPNNSCTTAVRLFDNVYAFFLENYEFVSLCSDRCNAKMTDYFLKILFIVTYWKHADSIANPNCSSLLLSLWKAIRDYGCFIPGNRADSLWLGTNIETHIILTSGAIRFLPFLHLTCGSATRSTEKTTRKPLKKTWAQLPSSQDGNKNVVASYFRVFRISL